MTVDNLAARGIHKPLECQFCGEKDSVHHLFFDCIVAKQLWACLSEFNGSTINSYFDMASKWIDVKKKIQNHKHNLCRSGLVLMAN